jgi:N-acetylglucosamine kinase-like BadF-type ATPase
MRDPNRFVLGLDGGGSKTIAFIAREDGQIVATGKARGSEIYGGGEAALATISNLANEVIGQAGLKVSDIQAATFSLAGVDWPEDFAYVKERLSPLFPCDIIVQNDAIGALGGAIPDGPAIVVACGTGCATASRNHTGAVWHSSFWQYPLGSHEMGIKALQAICLAHQGIGEPTRLEAMALETLQLPSVERLLHALTHRGSDGRPWLGRLTQILLDAAQAGDPVSQSIVRAHGAGLGEIAAVAARQVGISGQAMEIALTGGVFRHPSSLLSDALLATVKDREPLCIVVEAFGEPIVGSIISALRHFDIATTDTLLSKLRQSMPSSEFFDTK